jgi:hypothetical protein
MWMTLTTVGPLPRIRSPVHDTPLPGTMVYPTPQPHEIDDSHKCTHGRHASSPLQYDLHLDEKLCGSAKRRPVSMARRAKRVERAGTLALALALALVLTDVAPLSLPICVGHHQHIRDLPPARDVSTSTHRHRLIAIDSSPSTHRHRLIAIDSSPSTHRPQNKSAGTFGGGTSRFAVADVDMNTHVVVRCLLA